MAHTEGFSHAVNPWQKWNMLGPNIGGFNGREDNSRVRAVSGSPHSLDLEPEIAWELEPDEAWLGQNKA